MTQVERPRLTGHLRATVGDERDDIIDIEWEDIRRQRILKKKTSGSDGNQEQSPTGNRMYGDKHDSNQPPSWNLDRFGGRAGGYDSRNAYNSFMKHIIKVLKPHVGDSNETSAASFAPIIYDACLSDVMRNGLPGEEDDSEMGGKDDHSAGVGEIQQTVRVYNAKAAQLMDKMAMNNSTSTEQDDEQRRKKYIAKTRTRIEKYIKEELGISNLFDDKDFESCFKLANELAIRDVYTGPPILAGKYGEIVAKNEAETKNSANTHYKTSLHRDGFLPETSQFGEVLPQKEELFGQGQGYNNPYRFLEPIGMGNTSSLLGRTAPSLGPSFSGIATGTAGGFDSKPDMILGGGLNTSMTVGTGAGSSSSSSSGAASIGALASPLSVLKTSASEFLAKNQDLPFTLEDFVIQLIQTLEKDDQNSLMELLAFDFEEVEKLYSNKDVVLKEWKSMVQKESKSIKSSIERDEKKKKQFTMTNSEQQEMSMSGITVKTNKKKTQVAGNQTNASGASDAAVLQQIVAKISTQEQLLFGKPATMDASLPSNSGLRAEMLGISGGADTAATLVTSLPVGTQRKVEKDWERVDIPPPAVSEKAKWDPSKLIPISDLPEWAQPSFKGAEFLNVIQSKVFKAAFRANANLLMCAPTGAGKTNVALLTILKLIHQKLGDSDGKLELFPDQGGAQGKKGDGKKGKGKKGQEEKETPGVFKIIYLAPMKALCGEVVEKFTEKLQHLGIQVRELTGDMNLSKQELDRTHVIVTVPEKFDVMTRNSTAGGSGISDDKSLQKLVELIIIDEIHLLNESRGAIIETVVARTLRYQETAMHHCRLVGLSATLPNYKDVGQFLRVEPHNIFHFDGEYRPIPLNQSFIGVKKMGANPQIDSFKRQEKMLELTFNEMFPAVKDGHQVMIFVHSRMDTLKTAKKMIEMINQKNASAHFKAKATCPNYGRWVKEVEKAKAKELKDIFQMGFGMHHAGLLRSDRNLTEKMFMQGGIKVLCCTATLAWGVNLPARHVIIKGTQVYDASRGGFCDVGILDIMQIFGRAGRPGFDTVGHACLITDTKEKLDMYLQKMLHQLPIDSCFHENIENSLNAEISMGNISSEKDGAQWLVYTYLFVRMYRTPQSYGITLDEIRRDPMLERKRREMISDAAKNLCEARLIRIDSSKNYFSTDLGRVATKYYLDFQTAADFSNIAENSTDTDILRAFGEAKEFEQLKIRDDEIVELDALRLDPNVCPVKIKAAGNVRQGGTREGPGRAANANEKDKRGNKKEGAGGGVDDIPSKVSVLLQTYISRKRIEAFSLVSDSNYIIQNANRLFRAMFEMTLTRVSGRSSMTETLLEWSKMVENRIWKHQHMLRHFCYPPSWNNKNGAPQVTEKGGGKGKQAGGKEKGGGKNALKEATMGGVLKEETVERLEGWGSSSRGYDYWELMDIEWDEIRYIIPNIQEAKLVSKYRYRVPQLEINHTINPVTSTIMRIKVSLKASAGYWEWSDNWSGNRAEPFYLWVENPMDQNILHVETFQILKQSMYDECVLSFVIPLSLPHPPQYQIVIISERWVGLKWIKEFTLSQFLLPDQEQNIHTPLLDLIPLPKTALQNPEYEKLYRFSHFNAVQTQLFHCMYHTDYNSLVGAPTGSGKTNIGELAMLRLFNTNPEQKVIYIAPLKALAKERMDDWCERFGKPIDKGGLGKRVVELTGDFTPDVNALDTAQIIITTPEKWDGISRHWQTRGYVRRVGLVIIDEIHLLGQDRGPVLEVIVSRMRYISDNLDLPIRFVGLSTALANASDIADWLGIGMVGLFNFKPSVRPVPMTVHVQGYSTKNYCPRMASMNKPCYQAIKHHSPTKPSLIFVSSRRQTRLTAQDLIAYIAQEDDDGNRSEFRKFDPATDEEYLAKKNNIKDQNLASFLEYGIGIHHAGLAEEDRSIVESFYLHGKIMILIATSTLAWGVNFPAHLVIVKGTEYYDGASKRYVDFPITDVLQMMGRGGRPQFDDSCVSVIMVHEPKKSFYRRFIYEPFPVESSLHEQLTDHLNAEINAKTITNKQEAIDYVTWTYFFRRLTANPAYYSPELGNGAIAEGGDDDADGTAYGTGANSAIEAAAARAASNTSRHLVGFIEKLMDKCLADLVRCKCVKLKNATIMGENGEELMMKIEPAPLGKIASLYYMTHRTVFGFQQTLARHEDGMSFVEILRMICDCPEYKDLPVRHNEDKTNMEFSDRCPIPLDLSVQSFESPHTKAFLLLQAHLFQLELPTSDYKTDLKSVLDRTIPIIQALVDIASEEAAWKVCLNLMLLLQCIHQATHPWRSTLFTLPYVHIGNTAGDDTSSVVKFLSEKENIYSLPELIERQDCNNILFRAFGSQRDMFTREFGMREDKQRKMLVECQEICRSLPKVRMHFQLYKVSVLPNPKPGVVIEEDFRGRKIYPTQDDEIRANSFYHPKSNQWKLRTPIRYEMKPHPEISEGKDGGNDWLYSFAVPSGAKLELEIYIWYENKPMQFAYAPKFPKKKTYSWWLLIGEGESDELISMKRVLMQTNNRRYQKKAILDFEAPEEEPGEAFILNLVCSSDSFVGLDQQYDLEICMTEPEPETVHVPDVGYNMIKNPGSSTVKLNDDDDVQSWESEEDKEESKETNDATPAQKGVWA